MEGEFHGINGRAEMNISRRLQEGQTDEHFIDRGHPGSICGYRSKAAERLEPGGS
jgi:hypothetical protein